MISNFPSIINLRLSKIHIFSWLILLTVCYCQHFNKFAGHREDSINKYSYNKLLKSIQQKNARLRNSLNIDRTSTRNEVGDFDYIMDEKAVQRASSRNKLQYEELVKAHYMKLAMANVNHVLKTAKCRVPTRRCLDVSRMDVGKTKKYMPNCALVHKCAHDSGCCSDPENVCSPVQTETIELFFFSLNLDGEKQRGGVEILRFENHTSCACRPRMQTTTLELIPKECLCPRHFSPVTSSLECRCNCAKKNSKICRRVKKGKRSFFTKKCKKTCGSPDCDYGDFKRDFGRCPRKAERIKPRK